MSELQTPDTIGVARMSADGTLVLDLIASDPSGVTGRGRLVYPTSHPQYASILAHVGNIEAGEEKPVKPWPD